jgi:hypothetical protein
MEDLMKGMMYKGRICKIGNDCARKLSSRKESDLAFKAAL